MRELTCLSDLELIENFRDCFFEEQSLIAQELEYLGEIERRRLTFEYPSLWEYLVHECGMEESSALRRIRAARLLTRMPALKEYVRSGKLNLSLLELGERCAKREGLTDP